MIVEIKYYNPLYPKVLIVSNTQFIILKEFMEIGDSMTYYIFKRT